MDAAGVIEMVGENVHRLAIGQEVMAAVQPRRPEGGAQAELLVVPAASVVPIPDGASLEQAATLPMTGLTAMLGLQTLGLTAGQTLAVSGGAGQLASYVIALAKELGASVIADARAEDEDLVRGFGADVVVPRSEGFSKAVSNVAGHRVDALFDTALLCEAGLDAIRDGGRMVTVRGWRPDTEVRDIAVTPIRVGSVLERTEWLEELREFASKGRLPLRVAAT
jgi:NADPH:quinone reductase-like Zn-dependent oxidoreductase